MTRFHLRHALRRRRGRRARRPRRGGRSPRAAAVVARRVASEVAIVNTIAEIKQRLWAEIDRRRDELARLCADSLRVPAENPPGDTTAIASHYTAILERAGLRSRAVRAAPGNVSLGQHPARAASSTRASCSTATSTTSRPTTVALDVPAVRGRDPRRQDPGPRLVRHARRAHRVAVRVPADPRASGAARGAAHADDGGRRGDRRRVGHRAHPDDAARAGRRRLHDRRAGVARRPAPRREGQVASSA